MAALKQSRSPDQAATTKVPSSQTPAGASLGVRLWPGNAQGSSDAVDWNKDPAACLVIDLVTASDGTSSTPSGPLFSATFDDVRGAVFVARRLQWAMQGFSEAADRQGVGIALLVSTAEESTGKSSESSLSALDEAKPGQILLTEGCCRSLGELPIFSLQASAVAGLQELLWRVPGDQASLLGDEQKISHLIEQLGIPDPALVDSGRHAKQKPAATDTAIAGSGNATTTLPSRPGLLAPVSGGKSRWLIGGAVAAALLIVLAGIFAVSHRGAASGPAEPAASASNAPASQPSPPPSNRSVQPPQAENKPPGRDTQGQAARTPKETARTEKATKAQKNPVQDAQAQDQTEEAAAPPPPEPKQAKRVCDLDEQEIPDEIDTAERSLARGHYQDAQRQFGAVLGCEPGNARARAGQERVKRAVDVRGAHQ
jgi:hypothetical protein